MSSGQLTNSGAAGQRASLIGKQILVSLKIVLEANRTVFRVGIKSRELKVRIESQFAI